MPPRKQRKSPLPVIVAVTVAVAALAIALFTGYRWHLVLSGRPAAHTPFGSFTGVSPDTFSRELAGNLPGILASCGIDGDAVTSRDSTPDAGEVRTQYAVAVPSNISMTLLNYHITAMARDMGGMVLRGVEEDGGRTLVLTLGVKTTPTDRIILKRERSLAVQLPRLAVVVDDLGIKDTSLAGRLCGLDQTITLAVLPFQRHTDEVLRLARDTGTPFMLHMPMQPESETVDPGDGALLVSDDDVAVRRKLERAFASVKGAAGLNNHMGSRATADVQTMERVMTYLGERNYFFIDSRTSTQTVGYVTSQRANVRSAAISGYIDVEDDPTAIETRVRELAESARKSGTGILLGHDRPNTVAVLERMLPELASDGFRFVPVADLVR